MHNWNVYSEFKDASEKAADFLAEKIQESLQKKSKCHVILPGGNTPAMCLSYLADKNLEWEKIHWYLGDERCYPAGHEERNDVMLEKNLWSKISPANVHRILAAIGAEKAARKYREEIASIENFDIAFLGMGEDGHTASLFPGNKALNDQRSVVPVYNSPKPPADRVSMSLQTLQRCHYRMVLASGAAKAEIIKRIKEGEELPINRLGKINWFVDKEAIS